MSKEYYILYVFLKKLYGYCDDNLKKSIFMQIPLDFITEYLRPIIYLIDTTNDKTAALNFINYYLKESQYYPEEFKISKLEAKIIKLIIKEDNNIKNYYLSLCENNNISNYETPKTNFMQNQAKEYIDNVFKIKKKFYKK